MKQKIIYAILSFILITTNSLAQEKKQFVAITNADVRVVAVVTDYFTKEIQYDIMRRISPARFVDIKNLCNESSYPECVQKLIKSNAPEFFKSVKLERIATFDNVRDGKNYGNQSVLQVKAYKDEYLKSKGCDCKDGFYIIIPSSAVKVVE